ncbi:glycosyltransferase family 4 protein [Agromyces sp. MMS24-K17]|uniref:glycosyltransferase family 4 protein n=1 Tax=Agromyces sp. MMS24-K17 TaxID=3372850 RepID=UPI00375514C0
MTATNASNQSDSRRQIHVLLPGASRHPVGGYKVVYQYANVLAERGEKVTLWHTTAFFAASDPFPPRVFAKSSLRRLLMLRDGSRIAPWFEVDPRIDLRLTALRPRPRLTRHDLVVSTAIETTPWANRLAFRAHAKSLAFVQHFEDWAAGEAFVLRNLGAADARIVIAPWLQEKLDAAGIDSVMLPNAMDVHSFPTGPPLDDRESMVLSLMSPIAIKRPDLVIAVFEHLRERHPHWRFSTFGTAGRPQALPEFVEHWQDPTPQALRDLYQAAAVYLCVSDAEGWHLPPAEATLSGCAVVSTDIGGVRASMGEDALYAPPGDAIGLSLAVERAMRERTEANARMRSARDRLASTSIEANVQHLLEIAFG